MFGPLAISPRPGDGIAVTALSARNAITGLCLLAAFGLTIRRALLAIAYEVIE